MTTTLTAAFLYLTGCIATRLLIEALIDRIIVRRKFIVPLIIMFWPVFIWTAAIGGLWQHMRSK